VGVCTQVGLTGNSTPYALPMDALRLCQHDHELGRRVDVCASLAMPLATPGILNEALRLGTAWRCLHCNHRLPLNSPCRCAYSTKPSWRCSTTSSRTHTSMNSHAPRPYQLQQVAAGRPGALVEPAAPVVPALSAEQALEAEDAAQAVAASLAEQDEGVAASLAWLAERSVSAVVSVAAVAVPPAEAMDVLSVAAAVGAAKTLGGANHLRNCKSTQGTCSNRPSASKSISPSMPQNLRHNRKARQAARMATSRVHQRASTCLGRRWSMGRNTSGACQHEQRNRLPRQHTCRLSL